MIRNLEAALFFGGLALAACDGGQPLVFVSADTLGIDVSVSTSAQPLTLTFGWKENNVSFVPVTAYDKAGIPYEIRGCGQTGLGDSKVNPCAALKGTGSPGSTDTASPRVAANNADPELEVTPKPTLLTAAMTSIEPVAATAFALPSNSPSGSWQSMRDSLSVYSSFNAGTSASAAPSGGGAGTAGPQVGINLGKVFATGVAAQNLTEGQDYLLQGSATSQCVAQLANAVGAGKVTETTLVQVCGQRAAPAQSH